MIRNTAAALAAVVLAAYVAIAAWYGGTLNYFDPAEPTVTAVAFAFSAGQPLYPALDAAERYVHVWGPNLFLAHAGVMAVAGASIIASKAVGAVAALLSLVIATFMFRARVGLVPAVITSGLCALVYLDFTNVTFWTRADPLLLLCVTLGLAGSTFRRPLAAAVAVGVALGVAVNLKATGFFYLLPVVAIVGVQHGARAVVIALAAGTLTTVGPFLLARVSLPNYVDYLQLSARDGPVFQKVRLNLLWAGGLSVPLAGLWWSGRSIAPTPHSDRVLIAVAASMASVAVIGAKAGGGPFHLLPFVPVLAFLSVSWWSAAGKPSIIWLAPFVVIAALLAALSQVSFISTTRERQLDKVIAELRQIADAEPGRRIAVGYAGTAYASYARPEIVFRMREYWLDAPAVQEHSRAGLDLPEATLKKLDECAVEVWLVPRHGDAFGTPNAYFSGRFVEIFPPRFREIFFNRYDRTDSTEFFDIWRCRR